MSDDEPKGCPDWIVTFSDIISLLVTFFVLMLTWSTIEEEKFYLAVGSLQGTLGAVGSAKQRQALIRRTQARSERSDIYGSLTPPEEEPIDAALRSVGLRLKRRLGAAIETEQLAKGRAIRITPGACFHPGSAALSAAQRRALEGIAQAIAGRTFPLRITGHTDDTELPIQHERPPQGGQSGIGHRESEMESRWRLSAARAAAAAHHLVAVGGLEPQRISIATCADRRPAFPNRSPSLRERNRRLEITLLGRSRKK